MALATNGLRYETQGMQFKVKCETQYFESFTNLFQANVLYLHPGFISCHFCYRINGSKNHS